MMGNGIISESDNNLPNGLGDKPKTQLRSKLAIITHRILIAIKVFIRRLGKPAFLIILLISFALWYGTKLNYTYRTDMRIPITIGDTTIQVICTVEGIGSRLMMQKMMPRRHSVVIHPDQVEFVPSQTNDKTRTITPFSLQSAISTQIMDMKIISVKSRVTIEADMLK